MDGGGEERNLPEDLFGGKLFLAHPLGEEEGTGDGREEQKLPLSNSRSKSRRQRGDPGECFYGILIPRIFLQFLNFKRENRNTDVDMKRFIVALCHYCHRPCCYYR